MDETDPFRIKIKPIKKKIEKKKLPLKPDKSYPANLLVIFLPSEIREALCRFAASDLDYELGGVLVGKVGMAGRRMFVEICDFVPAAKGISRRASFEFTNEAQQEIHDIVDSKFKELRIVGWFHTHPGYGIFLSSADCFIDQNYFNQKFHIAVVIDPCRSEVELGAFVWNRNQERVRVSIFET